MMVSPDWSDAQTVCVGVLLAAGAGRRMGGPKALLRDRDGTSWLVRSVQALRDGGCTDVVVVLGCEYDSAAALLADQDVMTVVADDWASGMGASLRAGLNAADENSAQVAVVSLVDLPDVGPAVVRRVLGATRTSATALARATYNGLPGHPVVLGRDHWPAVIDAAVGDRGARDYLAHAQPTPVECGDLARGHDVDEPRNRS